MLESRRMVRWLEGVNGAGRVEGSCKREEVEGWLIAFGQWITSSPVELVTF